MFEGVYAGTIDKIINYFISTVKQTQLLQFDTSVSVKNRELVLSLLIMK